MPVPLPVTQWVNENYGRPLVDPEWLDLCYAWLMEEGYDPDIDFQRLTGALRKQILGSSLSDSMLHGTGLPTHVGLPTTTTTLIGPQILVEVVSLTEIANSAFSLNQTRVAIEERIKDGTVDDGEGEGDIDVEGEGPMPKYPRGMLKLHLTDGATTLQAIEYRSLPELSLENTPLGYKMFLKNVVIRRGIAFLDSQCVEMLGNMTQEREDHRQVQFAQGLRLRMGLPEIPTTSQSNQLPPVVHNTPLPHESHQQARSPLREISSPVSPPTQYLNDDGGLESRRRRVPIRSPDHITVSTVGSIPAPSGQTTITSSYFTAPTVSDFGTVHSECEGTKIDLVFSPTRKAPQPLFIDSPPSLGPEDEEFWLDDGMSDVRPESQKPQAAWPNSARSLGEITTPPDNGVNQGQQRKGSGKENRERGGYSSEDFGDDDIFAQIDEEILEELDAVEKEAYASGSRVGTIPSPVSANSDAKLTSSASGRGQIIDVITIDDDDDDGDGDDKENVPVPTRHVRRRIDENRTSGPSNMNRGGAQIAGPAILGETEVDVIDLSDSD